MQNIPFKTNLPAEPYNDYNLGEVGLPSLLCTDDLRIKLLSLERAKSPSWARFILQLRQTLYRFVAQVKVSNLFSESFQ